MSVEDLLENACARNTPAELHYEDSTGMLSIGRARLLSVEDGQLIAERPLHMEGDTEIPVGVQILIHINVDGNRIQFKSAILKRGQLVRLNAKHLVPGITLRIPGEVSPSQRRATRRISLISHDPIAVTLARPHADIPCACWIDAQPITAWLIDLSVGGSSLLVDRAVLGRVQKAESFYQTFTLPAGGGEFLLYATVRQSRVVEASNSLRMGLNFRRWEGSSFSYDQQRLSRFLAGFERRALRRRR